MSDIPQWAIDRARREHSTAHGWLQSFARYIAAHEKPPVDPMPELLGHILEAATALKGGAFRRGDWNGAIEILRAAFATRDAHIAELEAERAGYDMIPEGEHAKALVRIAELEAMGEPVDDAEVADAFGGAGWTTPTFPYLRTLADAGFQITRAKKNLPSR